MIPRKIAIFASSVLCLWSAVAFASRDDGVRLLQADARSVAFEVATPLPQLVKTESDYTELQLPGWSPTGAEGEPVLPARIFWVGVPDGMTVQVETSALETKSFDGARLAPRKLERGNQTFDQLAASPAYLADRSSTPLAVVRTVTGMRTQRVAAIEVRPARYDPRSGRLEVATRISVQVTFKGRGKAITSNRFDPGFEGIYRELLLNYESARAFRRPAERGGARTGFEAAQSWVRVRVAGKGIQEIRGSDLAAAGVAIDALNPNALELFTWPGIPLLPETGDCDSCGLAQVAIRVEGGEDGHLDANDRILFFGLGPSGWQDDYLGPGRAPAEWLDHPYETNNVYWLALDATGAAARWIMRDVTPAGSAPVATQYPARLHYEADLAYVNNLYQPGPIWDPWAWQVISSFQGPVGFDGDATGAIEGQTARVRARVQSTPSGGQSHQMSVAFNDQLLATLAWSGPSRRDLDTTSTHIVDGPNRLLLSLATQPGGFDSAWLFFWELRFGRRFQAVGDTLEFTGLSGPTGYTVATFTQGSSLNLLDVSNPLEPVELVGWQASDTTGGVAIHFEDDADSAFYFVAADPGRKHPRLDRMSPRDIRHGGADYLVICSDALEGDAMRLAAHRSSMAPPFPGARTAVVRMSDILAWYSGGRMDPVAIRNFLHDAVTGGGWQPAPSYVCFLGDATLDYKNILKAGEPGLGEKQVPTFQHNYWVEQYSSDDWLVDLDAPDPIAGGVPDLIAGRLPAANGAEAAALVDKVIAYDASPEYGPWRNRMLNLVDDVMQGNQIDPLGTTHIEQSDSLERGHTPPWLDRGKVELIEYPFTSGTSKDGARRELMRRIDEGALFWHFIGHGNPFKLADENAFILTDVPLLNNGARLPYFVASSCEVGPFDAPFVTSLGEALLKKSPGGVIASYVGTIETFAFANFNLGMALYDATLTPPELGGTHTIGEAGFVAKHRDFVTQNDRPYHVLGDPGTRLAMPREDVRLAVFDDVTGDALTDSIPRGRRIRVEGEVHGTRDRSVSDLRPLDGSTRILVTDAPVRHTVPDVYNRSASYDGNPRTAYSFDVPVSAGRFTARFIVPTEATLGERARVSAYFNNAQIDGSGAAILRIVDGAPQAADSTGPAAQFAGGLVAPNEIVRIELEDESGIKTLEDSPLDPIQVAIDGGDPMTVTPSFRYDSGSSTKGAFELPLPEIADGVHTLTVSASDNLADASNRDRHRSVHAFEVHVAAVVASAEMRALVLPNPFLGATGTVLVFTGLPGPSTSRAAVYDLRGRLVRSLSTASDGGHAEMPWDGKDGNGKAVPAGIYFYRASVIPLGNAERRFEGRFVVLN